MALTPEELDQIKAGDLSPLQSVQTLGIVIRTAAQEQTYRDNLSAQLRDTIRGEEDVPAYKNIESSLEQLTGEKRNEGEKASEFLARVVGPLKKAVDEKEAELAELKDKTPADDKDNPRIKALQVELDRITKERDDAVSNGTQKINEYLINGELERARQAAEAIPLTVSDDIKGDIIEIRMQRFLKDFEVKVNDKGETQVIERATGNVQVDTTDMSFKKSTDLVGKYFDDIKAQDGAEGGTGGAGKIATDGGKTGASTYQGAKSRQELHESLQKDGLSTDSEQFMKLYSETLESYKAANGQDMPIKA